LADPTQRPPTAPSAIEPDDEDEEEPKSTLPPDVADREAERAIKEIEEEVESEHPTRARPPPPRAEGPQKSFIDKAWEKQYAVEARLQRIGHGRYSRVLKMARKPEPEEFRKASQITGLGIAVIGFVGFLIYLFMQWLMSILGVT
jgi:protein transport protein SEC61 subunit gamma and related proteins